MRAMIARGTPSPSWEDTELLAECVAGNELAWGALVDKYKNLVFSVAYKYRLTPEDSADVFQSTWSDLYQELRKGREVRAVRSWIATVAAHKSYQLKSRLQAQSAVSLTDIEDRFADARTANKELLQEAQQEQMLRESVAALPERCRRIVQLLFFTDPPIAYRDLARELGLAEGSIGFIRGRCLKRLEKLLGESGF